MRENYQLKQKYPCYLWYTLIYPILFHFITKKFWPPPIQLISRTTHQWVTVCKTLAFLIGLYWTWQGILPCFESFSESHRHVFYPYIIYITSKTSPHNCSAPSLNWQEVTLRAMTSLKVPKGSSHLIKLQLSSYLFLPSLPQLAVSAKGTRNAPNA